MATGLSSALSQLVAARDSIIAEIRALDAKIGTLHAKRARLTTSAVSKADFVHYLRVDIARRGDRFAQSLKRQISATPKDFAYLKRVDDSGAKTAQNLLTEGTVPVDITDGAVFFYFGDLIADRIETLIEDEPWPDVVVTNAERIKLISGLDAELEKLSGERDELANQLRDAGMTG